MDQHTKGSGTRRVTWQHTYGLARIVAALDTERIDSTTPDPAAQDAIRALLPGITDQALHYLWAEARIDAAALGQLASGDAHRWPLSVMDVPDRQSARFDGWLLKLERDVTAHIAEALRPNPDTPAFPCTWCGGNGCRHCGGTGELLDRGAA